MSEHEALPALDELVAIRLLATAGRTLVFPHDRIREVAYLDSGEPRRRLYHERALELLDGAGAAPAELVRHALAADLADRALGLSIAAGDNALRLCAARDAIVHYERARALSPNTPNAHVFLQLGRAYELATEFPLARRAYEELLGAAQAASDGRVECAAPNRLATRPRWSRSRSGTRDGAAGSVHARDAQQFGRENGLLVAIRGGGHNGPGLGSCDDGLVIDLSLMKSVRVNPANRTVRVDPGCTSGDVDHATHAFGLAVPFGIVSTTGVAGLTLGGGTGYLTRKYGLTIDNLLEVDIVLADGRLVSASKSEHPDLFWALRGGGGNFGVVTSFLFQAHPVDIVYAGPIFWETTHAREVMRAYRDFLPTAPEELGAFVGLKTVPSLDPFPRDYWGKRACAIVSNYNGPASEGEKLMARLLEYLPPPIFNWMGEMPFPAMQALFDPFFPKGRQWYWQGDFVKSLPDEAIDTHIAQAANAPSELSLMHLYPIDGAVHRVPKDATAWNTRDAMWSMVIAGIDADPKQAEALKTWGRAYWAAIHPFNLEGAYVNFMMDDEVQGRLQATYGDNYKRLASVKAKYDPENFFRVNQNIQSATG